MSIYNSIATRKSVRTFEEKQLSKEDIQKIMDCAKNSDNPYNLPIEWFLLDESYGLSSPVIVGTDIFIAGKMKQEKYAEEAFGYAFEKVVLYAESIGVGTTWIAGTMKRENFEKAINLQAGEVMPCMSPIGYPAKKMSLRETMMRKGIRADSRFEFSELFFDGSFDKPLLEEKAGVLKDVLNAVKLAPSAVNKQPWRVVIDGDKAHFYEKRSKGYVAADGWDIQKIDMGIALCHFDVAAKEFNLTTSFEIADPKIPIKEDMQYIATYSFK